MCKSGNSLLRSVWPITAKHFSRVEAEYAIRLQLFEAPDSQAARGAIADAARLAQEHLLGPSLGRIFAASRFHGQEFKRQIPEQAIRHDHQFIDASLQRDF